MAEAKADGFGDRDAAVITYFAHPHAEPVADPLRAIRVAGLKAGCSGADPHVALAARRDQVVVEGCDAVDRRFGELVVGCDGADVFVGERAGLSDNFAQLRQSRRGIDGMVAACEFDQVAGHWLQGRD